MPRYQDISIPDMANICSDLRYKGLLTILDPDNKSKRPAVDEIQDNIEGKQETISDLKSFSTSIPGLLKTLAEALKGVSNKTDAEYHW